MYEKKMKKISPKTIFYILFTMSGFAGLIYESIWTHYLKLFLGNAAYAHTLVLAVFMGGLALGSWLSARYSGKIGNLLLGYAVAEVVIGICAIFFHALFVQFLDLAYSRLLPNLGAPWIVTIFKWVCGTLLILPQSILLGMTFPLMTAGVIRRHPGSPGETLSLLYFTNSLGAALGVLASGFVLVAWVGLPGTLLFAGFINIAVAAVIWAMTRSDISFKTFDSEPDNGWNLHEDGEIISYKILLVIAALTGLSSFVYEITWIRMLNLVLSSSTHAFELMLTAFITGIALGGLWIRRRIDRLQYPVRFLAWVQIAMGILALSTLPLYGLTFDIMSWLIKSLNNTAFGYVLFNISSQTIAMMVMLPATVCAGMTLPLITSLLLRRGFGEKSIGAVYTFNTLGCIIGVFVATYLAMPLLGLKGALGLGAGIDVALGIVLLFLVAKKEKWTTPVAACACILIVAPLAGFNLNYYKLAAGVYRKGHILEPEKDSILYQRDGKTATISITERGHDRTIRTNGKPDAAISMMPTPTERFTPDETTMSLLGGLPLLLNPKAETAANIGWGSGLTAHVLLSSPQLKQLDSIEIEPLIVDAAKLFAPRNDRAYNDPRSRIHFEDAKTFFSVNNEKYDIIVSEPSNPWVSGVAGLFSEEFYHNVRNYLTDQGILVQWLQLYEIDMPLVASVFKAIGSQFEDYDVYLTNDVNIVIVARVHGKITQPGPATFSNSGLAPELSKVGINGIDDIRIRRIGSKSYLGPLFATYPVPENSDYFPLLDLRSGETMFMGRTARELTSPDAGLYLASDLITGHGYQPHMKDITYSKSVDRVVRIHVAKMLIDYQLHGHWTWQFPENPLKDDIRLYADIVKRASSCDRDLEQKDWWKGMYFSMANLTVPYVQPEQLAIFWTRVESSSCWNTISQVQRDFIQLLKATGKRDSLAMGRYAQRILENEPSTDKLLTEYLLTKGLIGYIAAGRNQDAVKLWNDHGKKLSKIQDDNLLLRLILFNLQPGRGTTTMSPAPAISRG